MVAETVQHLDVVAATDVHHNLTKALWAEEAASPAAAHDVAVASPGPRPGTNEDYRGGVRNPSPKRKHQQTVPWKSWEIPGIHRLLQQFLLTNAYHCRFG